MRIPQRLASQLVLLLGPALLCWRTTKPGLIAAQLLPLPVLHVSLATRFLAAFISGYLHPWPPVSLAAF